MNDSHTILYQAAIHNDFISRIFYQHIHGVAWDGSIPGALVHYSDIIMGTMASQITSLAIVYSTIYSGADQRKKSKLRVTGLCVGNSSGIGEFPAQMASNTENVSIWWRHHEWKYHSLALNHLYRRQN